MPRLAPPGAPQPAPTTVTTVTPYKDFNQGMEQDSTQLKVLYILTVVAVVAVPPAFTFNFGSYTQRLSRTAK